MLIDQQRLYQWICPSNRQFIKQYYFFYFTMQIAFKCFDICKIKHSICLFARFIYSVFSYNRIYAYSKLQGVWTFRYLQEFNRRVLASDIPVGEYRILTGDLFHSYTKSRTLKPHPYGGNPNVRLFMAEKEIRCACPLSKVHILQHAQEVVHFRLGAAVDSAGQRVKQELIAEQRHTGTVIQRA